LEEILFNLISASIDKVNGSGTIKISAETQNNRVILSIEDDGDGFNPEEVSNFQNLCII
jgi:sensor histidine kinase YesM